MALRRFLLSVAGAAAFFASPVAAQVQAPTYTTDIFGAAATGVSVQVLAIPSTQ